VAWKKLIKKKKGEEEKEVGGGRGRPQESDAGSYDYSSSKRDPFARMVEPGTTHEIKKARTNKQNFARKVESTWIQISGGDEKKI